MLVINPRTNEIFECVSYEYLPSGFILGFYPSEEKRFKKAHTKDKFFKLTSEKLNTFEAPGITTFFKIKKIKKCGKGNQFYWRPGMLMFFCDELDNFGKARMINELRKTDSKFPWHTILSDAK
ncbi:MAG: hypothetical protein ACREBJ_04650 [Nitrosotalea sp.]